MADGTNLHSNIKLENFCEHLRFRKPAAREDLKNYVKVFLGIDVPDVIIEMGNKSPMDYLWHSFSCETEKTILNGDSVVWANRGGGKTLMAAVATLLDCVFKPGCQVRILAGSLDQAGRMYEYLVEFVNRNYPDMVDGKITRTALRFKNGSGVEILPQSAKSVRGRHIHKLRCDEVELFDKDVFSAAQFVTKSTEQIRSALEVVSTMHKPYGLMQEVVAQASKRGVPIFKWSLWEVIEKCVDRNCSSCPLWTDCGGRAKKAAGYMPVEDAITQMQRSSRMAWEAEMLCKRPMLEDVVFPEFSVEKHVRTFSYSPDLPIYRAIDFGYINPFVCLWLQVDNDSVVRIIDEYFASRKTVSENAAAIMKKTPCGEENVAGTFCDPAGSQSNDITGTSSVKELRRPGISVRYCRSGILEGIEAIRSALKPADGTARLLIDPKCSKLIEAMQCYHYPEKGGCGVKNELPLKDGIYDHPIDALRYFFANLNRYSVRSVKVRY